MDPVQGVVLQMLVDLGQRPDGSAHSDEALARSSFNPGQVAQQVLDVPRQGADLGGLGWVFAQEGFGQAHRPGRQHDGLDRPAVFDPDQLHAPTADVNHQTVPDGEAVDCPEKSVMGLLLSGQDAQGEADLFPDPFQELGLVAGIAYGAGSHGHDGVDAVRLAESPKDPEQANRAFHRLRPQQTLRSHSLAEADLFPYLIDQAERDPWGVGQDDQSARI